MNEAERMFESLTQSDLDGLSRDIAAKFGASSLHAIAFDGLMVRYSPRPRTIGDALRALPVIGILNVDNPSDPRHKEWS